MRSSSRADEGKSKDQQTALISSVGEIHRVAEANQLRLQNLEFAVANLTSICNALRNDMCSQSVSSQGSSRKVQAEAIDMNAPFSRSPSPTYKSKDDMLGDQMQQLVEQAASLGILKEPKTSLINHSGKMKTNSKAPTRPGQRKMLATNPEKRSTRSLVQTRELATDKKTSMKLARVRNTGATQLKPPTVKAVNTRKVTPAAQVSLKSTVKRTKTTMSRVSVDSVSKRSKETIIRNVETVKDNGSTTLRITATANQGVNSQIAANSRSQSMTSSLSAPPTAAKSDVKPRRKWSTSKEITIKK